jgi:dihydroceramide fatty acyl 2-hydroxylase
MPPVSQSRTERLASSPPLFENRFLDFFSRVHPAIPAVIFLPVIAGSLYLGAGAGYDVAELVALTMVGIGIWTLTEYWLHRLLFHWQPEFRGGDRLHFVIHGIHHDHPNDAMRLVMPPAASIPLAAIFAGLYWGVFGTPFGYPLFAGLIVGYLAYDYTHYFLHHGTPRSKFGKQLREQHMRHHFQDHRYGFGVSSPFWDRVFGTMPRRRTVGRRGEVPAGGASLPVVEGPETAAGEQPSEGEPQAA